MTLRADAIRERLAMARSNLAALGGTAALPRDRFLADRKEQWAAAYGLQTTVQALLDAGAHILSARLTVVDGRPMHYARIRAALED